MSILYTIWPLLNLASLVGLFIYAKLLSKRYRFFRLGLWITALVAIVYNSVTHSPGHSSIDRFQTAMVLPGVVQMKTHYTQLEDLPVFSIEQMVSLTPMNQSDSVQINSLSFMLGFVAGFRWTPTSIIVDTRSSRGLHYSTNGSLEWKLLGLTLYKQPKQFNGFLKS
jgi:hypothetical protein